MIASRILQCKGDTLEETLRLNEWAKCLIEDKALNLGEHRKEFLELVVKLKLPIGIVAEVLKENGADT